MCHVSTLRHLKNKYELAMWQNVNTHRPTKLTLFLTGCLAGPFVVLSTIFVLSSYVRTKRAWQTKSFSPRLGKKFMGLQRPIFGITLILAPIPAKKCVLQRQTESNHFFFLLPLSHALRLTHCVYIVHSFQKCTLGIL